MIAELIFPFVVLAIIFIYGRYFYRRQKFLRDLRPTLGELPMYEEMILVKWEKYLMPMRYSEYLEKWTLLTHEAKRKLARGVATKVKRGKIDPKRLGNETLKIINDEAQ